jgi:hypothetical protein
MSIITCVMLTDGGTLQASLPMSSARSTRDVPYNRKSSSIQLHEMLAHEMLVF